MKEWGGGWVSVGVQKSNCKRWRTKRAELPSLYVFSSRCSAEQDLQGTYTKRGAHRHDAPQQREEKTAPDAPLSRGHAMHAR